MRTRAALTIATSIPLLAGCRAFPAPAAAGTAYATTTMPAPLTDDVQITACGPGTTARVTITNRHLSGPADYNVTVAFKDAAQRTIASGAATARRLAPGQQTVLQVDGAPASPGPLRCTFGPTTRVSKGQTGDAGRISGDGLRGTQGPTGHATATAAGCHTRTAGWPGRRPAPWCTCTSPRPT
jgi:hypothetical protein